MTLSLIRGIWQSIRLLRSILFGLVITLWLTSTGYAVEVTGLYRVELPVSSQQVDERKRASTQALGLVIRRITGSAGALNEAEIHAALRSPERYVQQFSYFISEDAASENNQYLRLTFDKTLVNRLLREAKQPIWGSNRPGLIMWVAVEGRSGRYLLSAGKGTFWQRVIKQAEEGTGVPVLLPLMDLQDEISISLEDVWGLFRSKLEEASQRYRSEAVLGGRIYQTSSGLWAGRWLLIFEDEAISFVTEAGKQENLANNALTQVAGILVKHYAIDTSMLGEDHIKLSVQGVETLQDYAGVTSYLKQFAMVRDVAVSDIGGEELSLTLTTEGGWRKLKGLIALDKRLTPVAEATSEFDGDMLMVPYLWHP